MANIKDVAKMANVSISTVSRVINGTANVRQELRKKVMKAINELNYRSNPLARGLKGFPTRTLGLIIPNIENPFFPAMVRGVQDVANRNGYAIFLCNTDEDPQLEEIQYFLLLEKKIDGLLLVVSSMNVSFLDKEPHAPVVLLDRYVENSDLSYVVVDHKMGMNLVLKHLENIGRKKVVFLGSKDVTSGAKERLESFVEYFKGVANLKTGIFFGEYSEKSGAYMTQKLLSKRIDFDAIVCGNDLIAFGAIKVLKNHGVNIPDDVSVVGYDDIFFSAYHSPKLTTVHQPTYELGEIAAHLIIDEIEKKEHEPKKHIRLEPRLIVRETSISGRIKNVNS